jgi:hypothetical protein
MGILLDGSIFVVIEIGRAIRSVELESSFIRWWR